MPGIHRTRSHALFTIPLAIGLLAAAALPAGAAAFPGPPSPGLATSLTCRGAGVDPAARVRHRAEILINAPLRTVWKLQTDIERWPSWQAPEETHTGPQADADVPTATAILRQGLEAWLSDLKVTAEARAHHRPD
ncbi:hypothetical protein [Streptomyces sp. NBC_00354]|uniref:hypothetical protein n=1 Tax=Streptomyces sp. NBC_00354 TaxID=2975723 RepID=UPI002E275351